MIAMLAKEGAMKKSPSENSLGTSTSPIDGRKATRTQRLYWQSVCEI